MVDTEEMTIQIVANVDKMSPPRSLSPPIFSLSLVWPPSCCPSCHLVPLLFLSLQCHLLLLLLLPWVYTTSPDAAPHLSVSSAVAAAHNCAFSAAASSVDSCCLLKPLSSSKFFIVSWSCCSFSFSSGSIASLCLSLSSSSRLFSSLRQFSHFESCRCTNSLNPNTDLGSCFLAVRRLSLRTSRHWSVLLIGSSVDSPIVVVPPLVDYSSVFVRIAAFWVWLSSDSGSIPRGSLTRSLTLLNISSMSSSSMLLILSVRFSFQPPFPDLASPFMISNIVSFSDELLSVEVAFFSPFFFSPLDNLFNTWTIALFDVFSANSAFVHHEHGTRSSPRLPIARGVLQSPFVTHVGTRRSLSCVSFDESATHTFRSWTSGSFCTGPRLCPWLSPWSSSFFSCWCSSVTMPTNHHWRQCFLNLCSLSPRFDCGPSVEASSRQLRLRTCLLFSELACPVFLFSELACPSGWLSPPLPLPSLRTKSSVSLSLCMTNVSHGIIYTPLTLTLHGTNANGHVFPSQRLIWKCHVEKYELHTVINSVQVHTLPTVQVPSALPNSFFVGSWPFHSCLQGQATDRSWMDFSECVIVIVIVIVRVPVSISTRIHLYMKSRSHVHRGNVGNDFLIYSAGAFSVRALVWRRATFLRQHANPVVTFSGRTCRSFCVTSPRHKRLNQCPASAKWTV